MLAAYDVKMNTDDRNNVNVANRIDIECTVFGRPVAKTMVLYGLFLRKSWKNNRFFRINVKVGNVFPSDFSVTLVFQSLNG